MTIPMFLLFQNDSTKEVCIYFLNGIGERAGTLTLGPGEIHYIWDMQTLRAGDLVELADEKHCLQKFRVVKNGYLLIE